MKYILGIPWLSPVLLALLLVSALHPVAHAAETGKAKKDDASHIAVQGALVTEQPVRVVFNLGDYTVPQGAYTSINIAVIEAPQGGKPSVQSGYPASTITFHAPGTYTLEFVLNEVRKPSCGGVLLNPLLEERRTFRIE
jgi:hypothetical protein